MQSLAIVNPIRCVAISGTVETVRGNRVLSPDPKEAIVVANSSIVLDCGEPVTVDSLFIGYHSAKGAQTTVLHPADADGNPTGGVVGFPLAPLGTIPPYHSFGRGNVTTSRYFVIGFGENGSGAFEIGTIAIGIAWQAEWGHEWGAGRTVEDTGSSERLFGGGWATDDGVAASGYQWTFGDLQPHEVDQLYRIVKDRRTTRSLLVIEDPEITDGLNERLHWGLFRKLDAYERLDPLNTKWSLQIGDWA